MPETYTRDELRNEIGIFDFDEDENVMVSDSFDYTVGYKIEGVNSKYYVNSDIDGLGISIENLLNTIKDNIVIQIVYDVRKGGMETYDRYESQLNQDNAMVKTYLKWKRKKVESQIYKETSCYIFLSISVKYPIKTHIMLMPMSSTKREEDFKKVHEDAVLNLKDVQDKFEYYLKEFKVKYLLMNKKDMSNYGQIIMNPGSKGLPYISDNDIQDNICYSGSKERISHLELDGKYINTVEVIKLGDYIAFNSLNNFFEGIENTEYTLQVVLKKPNQDKERLKIRAQLNEASSMTTNDGEKTKENKLVANSLNEFEKKLIESNMCVFYMSMVVAVREDNLDDLKVKTNRVINKLTDIYRTKAIRRDWLHFHNYLSFLPGNWRFTTSQKMITARNAVYFFMPLLQKRWAGTKSINILTKNDNEEMIGFHLFNNDLSAKNAVVMAATGSGKSFTVANFINQYLMEDLTAICIVIDIGGSYRKLGNIWGAEYYDIKIDGSTSLNPFPLKNVIYQNGQYDREDIEFLIRLIEKMVMSVTIPEFDGRDQTIVSDCIIQVYDKLKDDESPLLSEIQQEMEKYVGKNAQSDTERARAIASMLGPFCSENGQYAKLINNPKRAEFNNRFILFDLQNVPAKIMSIVIFIISNVILSSVYGKKVNKLIIMDECAVQIQDESSAKLIETLYRTIRKHMGAIWSITQNPKSFLDTDNKSAPAIIASSHIKIFLQLEGEFDQLTKMMLNDKEIETVKRVKTHKGLYSLAYMRFGDYKTVLKLEPSPFEYWVCTTDPKDRIVEDDEIKRQNGNVIKALDILAEKYPNGIAYAS